MGNDIHCCNSVNQLNNVIHSPRLLGSQTLNKPQFPQISQEMKKNLEQAKLNQYYKAQTSKTDEKGKDTFFINNSNVIYDGQIVNEQACGRGRIYFENDSYFEGTFINGEPSHGIFLKVNSYYIGQILNFQANGLGLYQNSENGYKYEGSWKRNLPHGLGKEKYANKEEYEGNFMFGCKFGNGVYKFIDGKIYDGNFYNGISDGFGQLFMKNGDWYEGEWKLGQIHGFGTYYWKNGQKYVGEYKNGLKDGKGKYYQQNDIIYEGLWVDGNYETEKQRQSGNRQINGMK